MTFHDKELLPTVLVAKNYNFPGVLFVAEELPWKIEATNVLQYVSELNKKFPVKGERKCSNSMLMKLLCEQCEIKKATTFCQIQFRASTFETNCLE